MHEQSHSEEKKEIWTRKTLGRGILVLILVIAVLVVLFLLGIIVLD